MKKLVALGLSLCMTAGIVAGCGAPEDSSTNTEAPAASEGDAAVAENRQNRRIRICLLRFVPIH